jgi:hypothetical protein
MLVKRILQDDGNTAGIPQLPVFEMYIYTQRECYIGIDTTTTMHYLKQLELWHRLG